MKMEKILECLAQLGFEPELISEELGYRFSFEDLTLLVIPEEEADVVHLSLPAIFDATEENRPAVLEAMAQLCANVRFVQPVLRTDSVWVDYQHYCGEDLANITPDLIEHMVRTLYVGFMEFHKIINNEED